MSRRAMTHGRESKALAVVAATASIEASVTALELVAQLIADGCDARRLASPMRGVRSNIARDAGKENVIAIHALG